MKSLVKKIYHKVRNPQFIRYFIVGISVFVFDFSFLNFMVYVLKFDLLIGVVHIPNVISTFVSMAITFTLNRRWTFQHKGGKGIAKHSLRFALSTGTVFVLHNLAFGSLLLLGIIHPIAKVLVMMAQMVLNYFLYKYFVFR